MESVFPSFPSPSFEFDINLWCQNVRALCALAVHLRRAIRYSTWMVKFWAFFHRSLAVNVELGNEWPPTGILAFSPFGVPLLNTVVLLSSGVRVTWAHHSLMCGNHSQTKVSLILTVFLGAYFTVLQGAEYLEASFTFADSVYGSTFFLATGFHGLHVLIGTAFLTVCLKRLQSFNFRHSHHFGFEAAAWYWHFVDVVWLFLFVVIYWWGGA